MKFDPFGTSTGSVASYDWSDREEGVSVEARKAPGSDGSALAPPHYGSGLTFGSTENLAPNLTTTTTTTTAASSTFPTKDDASSSEGKFEAFPEPSGDHDDDFGDFASTVSDKSTAGVDVGPEEPQGEASDEFGAFQGDKPKFGKSDFLKASSQTKVKSSEEMIKNELATFDLCVQGESLSSIIRCLK